LECRTSRTLTDDDNPTAARARHEEPDILVFNNMSIIKGLPLKSPPVRWKGSTTTPASPRH
jgi:hypothetical protein